MKIGYAYIVAGLGVLFGSMWVAIGIKFATFILGAFVGSLLIASGVNWIFEIKKERDK